MADATYRGTAGRLKALLLRLPGALAGTGPDAAGVGRGIGLRMGVALPAYQDQF